LKERIVEMATSIVAANSTGRGFSVEILSDMIEKLVCTIQCVDEKLKTGVCASPEPATEAQEESAAAIPADWKKSIGIGKVTCLICGHQGKALAGHIKAAHKIDSKAYRKQFGIPARISLTSKTLQTKRRKIAKDSGAAERLKAAREAKKAKKTS
jgi:predicted transcriptional regulator